MYVDSCTLIADRLFHDAGVKVSKLNVFHKDGEHYRVILAKCRKKDFWKVAQVMDLLPSKALVCGWWDFLDFANDFARESGFTQEGDADGETE